MKRIFIIITVFFLTLSCGKEQKNMRVNGRIKGLQKGTVYLEKIKDTLLIKVDSAKLYNSETFSLQDNIESPEMYFISLSGSKTIIPFFAEKGTITIDADIDNLAKKTKIKGSKNQKLLEEYQTYISEFNNLRLEYLKNKFDAYKAKDSFGIKIAERNIDRVNKRQYRYTLNYCFTHANYDVAPYLTLTNLYDLSPKYMDTIIQKMPDSIKKSKYGKKLIEYAKEVKQRLQN
jgi:hypothetical protein